MDEHILGIDGTGSTARAALVRVPAGGPACCVGRVSAPSAAESLISLIESLLERGGRPAVNKIAVLVGPGSFTGIRSSVATALGLGAAWGAETLLVPFLRSALLARLTEGSALYAPYLSANRNETFCGAYRLSLNGDVADARNWEVEEVIPAGEYLTANFEFGVCAALRGRGIDEEPRFFEAAQDDGSAERAALSVLSGSFGASEAPGALYLKPVQARTLRERGLA